MRSASASQSATTPAGRVGQHEAVLAGRRRLAGVGRARRAEVERRVAHRPARGEHVVELGVVVGGKADLVVDEVVGATVEREHQREAGERALGVPPPPAGAPAAQDALQRQRVTVPDDGVGRDRACRREDTGGASACPLDGHRTGLEAQVPAEGGVARDELFDDPVQPAAHVPGAEGVLDVAGERQGRGGAPRVGPGVGREALDHHAQTGVAHAAAGEARAGSARGERAPGLEGRAAWRPRAGPAAMAAGR